MNRIKQDKLLAEINDVLYRNDYIFRNREDFFPERTSWESLSDITEQFYWILIKTKDELQID